jgi:hypothetical protein
MLSSQRVRRWSHVLRSREGGWYLAMNIPGIVRATPYFLQRSSRIEQVTVPENCWVNWTQFAKVQIRQSQTYKSSGWAVMVVCPTSMR